MSQFLPQSSVDHFRGLNNKMVEIYGIDADLYIPSNFDSLDHGTIYNHRDDDLTFTRNYVKVYIEWNPNIYKLKAKGLFTEDSKPILAYFGDCPEPIIRSYIKIDIQYIPTDYDTDEFEIVNNRINHMQDKVILKTYLLAPRRKKS